MQPLRVAIATEVLLLCAVLLTACDPFGTVPQQPIAEGPPILRGFSASNGSGLPESSSGTFTVYSSAAGGYFSLVPQWSYASGGQRPATSFVWELGGGFSPSSFTTQYVPGQPTLGDARVLALAPGSYTCALTATSAGGSDVYNFTSTILMPPPPVISDPPAAFGVKSGTQFSIEAYVPEPGTGANWDYGPTYSWVFDYGGGATPNVTTDGLTKVTAGAPGTYFAHVTVTNPAGSDSFECMYLVSP